MPVPTNVVKRETAEPVQILVVSSTTRPGRHGPAIADWVAHELGLRDDVDVTVADLGTIGLPLLDEPHHPSERRYVHEHTKTWSRLVDSADAFIFVTPEYNRAMPGSLKNALDYLLHEWTAKPAGFVSYSGGVSGGMRAVEMAKGVLTTLGMFPVNEMVNLPRIDDAFDGPVFKAPERAVESLCRLATALVRTHDATRALRS